ncbi:MAG: Gfo/Idh/MocA family oxidoreductase [Thermodesulfobacteriota bacterium]
MTALGAAVVGLGVGEQHALAYAATPGCSLRAVYDVDPARGQAVAKKFQSVKVAESFEEILADSSVDVVSLASYDNCHFDEVVKALGAQKHVFVEKPLCRSIDELRTIKEALQASGPRHLVSNLVLRAAPVYGWLRKAIQSRELGEIYAFDGDYLYGRIEKITGGWRKSVPDYSVMLGGGVHLVDLMLWLTGAKPVSVSASGNEICTAGTEFHYLDYVQAVYAFPSGLIGRITANFGCVHRHQHVVRVFGTKGTFIYDDQGPRLHASRDPAVSAKTLDLASLPATKGDLIPGFIRSILSGANPDTVAQHEFDIISACVAVDQSLSTGSSVEIAYV